MEANENQTLIDVGCALNGPETLENGKIPFVVVPEGYKVADLEHLLPSRRELLTWITQTLLTPEKESA
jgi:hypothetical protein